jgi:hypothetical protein
VQNPPAPDADAYTIWCALTAQTAWKDGLLRQMFFEDALTVLDVEDSAAGHHYWLNIITDITEEEELQWMWKFSVQDVLRDEALSEDGKKAVPFTSAAIIFKAAIRSNTKRAAFVETHGIEGTRRGMFGDQYTQHEREKRRGYSRPSTKLPPNKTSIDATASVVAAACVGCSKMHALLDLAKRHCITCWSNGIAIGDHDRRPSTKRTIHEVNDEPNPEPNPEPVQKKKKMMKKTKKKKKKTETEEPQAEPDTENESPAETNKQKKAELKIGQVVEGYWEVDDRTNAWEFGTVDKICWDEDPPKLGDAQWAYVIKWDDGYSDPELWHLNGEEWPMVSIRVPTAELLRARRKGQLQRK